MRLLRVISFVFSASLLGGCGYVHFGRYPRADAASDNSATGQAYSNLATEHKILKQELALARKEGDALRAAMEGSARGATSNQLTTQLNEAARELASLRASYARLQGERAARPADSADQARLSELEEKLAVSLRNYTQVQEENARLRSDLNRTRAENSALAGQLKSSLAQNEQAQTALAQLNRELLAEKDARAQAEQSTAAVRAQMSAVVSAQKAAEPGLSGARASPASSAAALQLAGAPPADPPPTAELRTNPQRLRAAATAEPAAPAPSSPRIHRVQAGDTLEKIAQKYYGAPERWSRIYAANNDLLRDGRALRAGMELEIPE
jgi:phage tail protein X